MGEVSRRHFITRGLLRQVAGILAGFEEGRIEAERKETFDRYFDSYESCYALVLAYPEDVLLETARRHGVPTEGREKKEIVKDLFRKQGGSDYRF
jgi:hypothetical protein